ncbi:hypothetical protein Acr_01g0007530 [Actinidia rufa]|uniref:Uncharacterized protein n=1 Tax=Actinidia rufa TaxID=165716 RepID=A0A7J0E370_9ERIC|nr:hypothetical protein Acr_01g0007530 [Actinidia rufa]
MTTMVMFYWGEDNTRSREGISYNIDATVCYDVELGTSVAQLHDMIIPMVVEYGEHMSIKFIRRYPHRRNGDFMIYKKLLINDDRILQNILNIPSRHPNHQHVEIYVVKEEGSTMNTSGSHADSSQSTLAEEAPGQRMCSLFSQGECIEAGDEDIDVLLTNEANDDFDDDGHEDPNVGKALHDNPHIPFFTNLVGADDVVDGRDLYDRCSTWSDVTPEFAKWMVFKDKDAVIRAWMEGVTLISDWHAAIISAVKHEWETARLRQPIGIHRYCLRHFRSNYQKNFGNMRVKDLIWKAGTAHQVHKFDEAMDEIKKLGTNSESAARAYRALCNEDPRKWTLTHDGGYRWGVTTTNDSECYNNVLRGARDLPITSCVEVTFYRLVATFNDKRRQIESALTKGLRYTSKVQAKLEDYQARSVGHHVTICNWASDSAEVVTSVAGTTRNNKHAVYLNPPSCDCGKWMIYHYLAAHALRVRKVGQTTMAFGVIPPTEEIDSGHLRMSWLCRTFDILPEHADDGHIAEGSAVLAMFCRSMCRTTKIGQRQIAGALLLLQTVWVEDKFIPEAPNTSPALHGINMKGRRIGQPGVPESPPTMPLGVPATSLAMPPAFSVHPPPSTFFSQQFTQYVDATQTSASYVTPTMPSYTYHISSHDVPSSSRRVVLGKMPKRKGNFGASSSCSVPSDETVENQSSAIHVARTYTDPVGNKWYGRKCCFVNKPILMHDTMGLVSHIFIGKASLRPPTRVTTTKALGFCGKTCSINAVNKRCIADGMAYTSLRPGQLRFSAGDHLTARS